ncbi:MAG: hypothetical protein HUU35_15020 [Armatimonadetes bacterium]|nr:hypothetical protein [Armatimonadota bacterium]
MPWPQVARLLEQPRPLVAAPPPAPSRQATASLFGDDPVLSKLEVAARRHLDLLVESQRHGGWCLAIKWPSLLQYTAKQRLPEPGNMIGLSKDSHTAFGAAQLLYAWQCLGDGRYLAAARRTGEMYLAAQDAGGSWMNSYFFEGGRYVSSDPYVLLQDHTQTGPLFLLTYLWRATGDDRYLAAARRSADFLVKAQNPNGSWAHHWDRTRQVGISSTGEAGGGEVNDYGTSAPVAALLSFATVTGEHGYVAPALRGADWLLTAFVENPRVVGWGAQYDAANRLIPARHFEPASVTNYAPRWAALGLLAAYRQTRDERYLTPLRKCLAWFEANRGDGGWWWDYEPDSGRPIAMWMRRIYHLDDPAEVAAYEQATGGRKPERGDWVNVAALRSEIEAAVAWPDGKLEPPPTRDSLARYVAATGPAYVASYLDGGVPPAVHRQAGLWLWESEAGLSTNLVRHQVVRFCDLLLRARAARGDLPLDHPLLRRIEASVGWTRVLPLPGAVRDQ